MRGFGNSVTRVVEAARRRSVRPRRSTPARCSHEVAHLREFDAGGERRGIPARSRSAGANTTSSSARYLSARFLNPPRQDSASAGHTASSRAASTSTVPPRLYATALTASIVQRGNGRRRASAHRRVRHRPPPGREDTIRCGRSAERASACRGDSSGGRASSTARAAARSAPSRCRCGTCRRRRRRFALALRRKNFHRTIQDRNPARPAPRARMDSDRRNTRTPPCRVRRELSDRPGHRRRDSRRDGHASVDGAFVNAARPGLGVLDVRGRADVERRQERRHDARSSVRERDHHPISS